MYYGRHTSIIRGAVYLSVSDTDVFSLKHYVLVWKFNLEANSLVYALEAMESYWVIHNWPEKLH